MKHTALKTRLAAVLLAGALAFGLTACGAGSPANDTAAASPEMSEASSAAMDSGGSGGALLDPEAASESSQKMIYTASVDMESTDFAGAQAAILAAVEQTGAYLESSELWGSAEDADRGARYTVRVPVEGYRDLLAALGQAGSVLSQSESARDVTSQYIDLDARLTALKAQRDRLNELADQAETTADLLEIESQLSDVQYQIESYTAQMRDLEGRVAYSTVDVILTEVAVLTPTGNTFGDRLAAAFFGGWRAFASFVESLFLTIVYLLPLLIVIAVLVVVVVRLERRRRARRAADPRYARRAPPYPGAAVPPQPGPQPPMGQESTPPATAPQPADSRDAPPAASPAKPDPGD